MATNPYQLRKKAFSQCVVYIFYNTFYSAADQQWIYYDRLSFSFLSNLIFLSIATDWMVALFFFSLVLNSTTPYRGMEVKFTLKMLVDDVRMNTTKIPVSLRHSSWNYVQTSNECLQYIFLAGKSNQKLTWGRRRLTCLKRFRMNVSMGRQFTAVQFTYSEGLYINVCVRVYVCVCANAKLNLYWRVFVVFGVWLNGPFILLGLFACFVAWLTFKTTKWLNLFTTVMAACVNSAVSLAFFAS